MKKLIIIAALVFLLTGQVSAMDLTAPAVPSSGARLMPENTQSFGEAVLEILGDALASFRPDLREAAASCVSVLAAVICLSLINAFPGHRKGAAELAGTVLIAGLLLRSVNSLVVLGAETVTELSDYGKLLLPVMTAALAAQGGITTSAALYTATAVFDAVLCGLVSKVMVPCIYLFLALAAGSSALGDPLLKKLRNGIKAGVSWGLKTILYVYTGYIGITGVVSGTTDAAALKAAKLTISGVVPVVGGILSDASEAVLVSAETVKNAAGIYGMLAVLAVWIGPFIRIGVHYLMLKALAALAGVFEIRPVTELIGSFSGAMGLLLAMTGSVCLMLIISTICFMKGAGL